MALFRLAWSAKLQIPVLITVVFMACDIRLQLEINIFWETNNGRPHANHVHGNSRSAAGQRRASREDMRRAALVAAALYQQQRRRLIQDIRAQQNRQRDQAQAHQQSNPNRLPYNAPLATEEDSDLDEMHENDQSESDTLTCSQRSTASEAGSFATDDEDTDDIEADDTADGEPVRKKKKRVLKRSRPLSKEQGDEEEEEDVSSDEDEDDDDDDDDDYNENGGGMNGGSSSHGGGGGNGYRDDYDHDTEDSGDNSQDESGGGYSSPLVVEVEIRHRALDPSNNNEVCQKSASIMPKHLNYSLYLRKTNYFSRLHESSHSFNTFLSPLSRLF